MTPLVGRLRGLFFLSHHPLLGLAVLAVLIALALWTQRRRP